MVSVIPPFSWYHLLWAIVIGGASHLTMPAGAWIGVTVKPQMKTMGLAAAFGAGALIAAMTLELVAPTVLSIVGQSEGHRYDDAVAEMLGLLGGMIVGGFVFVGLNTIINNAGGFLRKASTMIEHLRRKRNRGEPVHAGRQDDNDIMPTAEDFAEESGKHGGASTAIWLGLLIDTIPESFVIGMSTLVIIGTRMAHGAEPSFMDAVPFTLFVGLCIANLPEAMASAVGMSHQGMPWQKIMMMWSSLAAVAMVGAGLGYVFGDELPRLLATVVEGVAAGAMLTMIASAMLPEAVELSGSERVALGTLCGFVIATMCKLAE